MARPKYNIDGGQVEKLAMLGCPVTDIALVLGCNADTIHKRFSVELNKGRAQKRTRLRNLMWQSAQNGSVAMQIFLSKQYLGFADNNPQDGDEQTEDGSKKKLAQETTVELVKFLIKNKVKEVRHVDDEEKD